MRAYVTYRIPSPQVTHYTPVSLATVFRGTKPMAETPLFWLLILKERALLSLWKQKMVVGREPASPNINPPSAQTPLSAPRMERNLPGDLLSLSGAEEGGELILTSRGFFLAFMFFRPGVGHQVPPESTELGEELKKVVILLPPDRSCQL